MTSGTYIVSVLLMFVPHESFESNIRMTVPSRGHIATLPSNDMSELNKVVISVKGDSVILQCEFRAAERWSSVQWLKFKPGDAKLPVALKKKHISSTSRVSNATIAKVRKRDEGNYTCILTTLSSDPESYNFQIIFKKKPSCGIDTCSINGRCSESLDGYKCSCNSGFVGVHCTRADPCLSSPCWNNGTCFPDDEGYNCSCQAGYGGAVCEKEVCAPNICGIGGSCRIENEKIECICSSTTAGDRCQHACRARSTNYCSYSRKTCQISIRNNKTIEDCSCDSNRQYDGFKCMMKSDLRNECEDAGICNRHGHCYDQIYGYRCDCHSYTSGKNCELYNECRSGNHICTINGGTCVDLADGYKCIKCPPDQHGDKCQYKEDPCKVTCGQTTMTVQCDMRFLNEKLRIIHMYLNSKSRYCRLQGTYNQYRGYTRSDLIWKKNFGYTSCGTQTEFGADYVTYRNSLRAGDFKNTTTDSNSIITRTGGHFEFKMECTLALPRNTSNEMTHHVLSLNETLDLQDRKSVSITGAVHAYIFKDSGYRNYITQYTVGDRLYVKVFIGENGSPVFSQGYVLHVINCYATPTNETGNGTSISKAPRHYLIKNGCILDDTLEFLNTTMDDKRIVYFGFDSFAFKSKPGKLFLNCNSRVCLKGLSKQEQQECEVKCEKPNVLQDGSSHTTAPSPLSTLILNGTAYRTSPSSEVNPDGGGL